MKIDLTGKVAVMTGASRGIGLAAAKGLAAAGAKVALLARNEETIQKAAQEVASNGGVAQGFACDVSS